jgi:hypothetical protein
MITVISPASARTPPLKSAASAAACAPWSAPTRPSDRTTTTTKTVRSSCSTRRVMPTNAAVAATPPARPCSTASLRPDLDAHRPGPRCRAGMSSTSTPSSAGCCRRRNTSAARWPANGFRRPAKSSPSSSARCRSARCRPTCGSVFCRAWPTATRCSAFRWSWPPARAAVRPGC